MRDTAFFFVCLPLMCCSVLMGPIVVLFSLHRAISPHLSPQLSPFSTALEARSAEFARSWERRLRPLTRSGGSAGGGGARQQQPQEKKASSATSSDQADSSVPKAGPGGRCSEAREDALVRRLRSDEFAVAEEASQGLWECWLRERGESVYSEIQAATRLLDAKEYQAAEKKFTALATSHPKWAEPINKRASLACATAKWERAVKLSLQVLDMKPNHFGALSALSMALIRLGKLDKAEAWAKRLGQMQPRYARPLLEEIQLLRASPAAPENSAQPGGQRAEL